MEEVEAPVLTLLKTEGVMRKLDSYLELEDLENMREVSRGMNALILSQSQFLSQSKLVLNKEVYESPGFKRISFQPKNVEVSVFKVSPIECVFDDQDLIHQEITDMVCKLVKRCEHLAIREQHYWAWAYPCLEFQRARRKRKNLDVLTLPHHWPPVLEVISCVRNLKELKLVDGTELYLNKASEEHVEALNGILVIEYEKQNRFPYYIPPIFLKLRGLRRIDVINSSWRCQVREQLARFADMELNNKDTLSVLDLISTPTWYRSIFGNAFPSLKYLSIALGNGKEEDTLSAVEFLENHIDQLEELDLSVESCEADQAINTFSKCKRPFKTLIVTLQPNVKRSSSLMDSMKHLTVQHTPRTYWDHDSETNGAMTADIFSFLPVSLKSFTLTSESGIFYDHSKLKDFTHLTHLELNDFVGSLNSTLEVVCKYLHKLKLLEIDCETNNVPEEENNSDINTESDIGFATGLETFGNLRDLEVLIVDGQSIPLELINGIKCRKLWRLRIANELSLASLRRILEENPCLKYVNCGHEINCDFSES